MGRSDEESNVVIVRHRRGPNGLHHRHPDGGDEYGEHLQ
jgi:hypothetical protein